MTPVETAPVRIVDRGRGPAIPGTRITVYDVLDYYKHGWDATRIASLFRLSTSEVQAAIEYIQRHKEEVLADYERIANRHRTYEYPEHVRAVVDECRRAADLRLAEVRRRRASEDRDAPDNG